MSWFSRPGRSLGKVDVTGEETRKRTLTATPAGVQGSEERYAEITSRLQSFDNHQASEFAATEVVPTADFCCVARAAVAFTSEQNAVCCLPAHRMLAVRNQAIDGI